MCSLLLALYTCRGYILGIQEGKGALVLRIAESLHQEANLKAFLIWGIKWPIVGPNTIVYQ